MFIRFLMLVIFGLTTATDADAQAERSGAVPHYITGLQLVEPNEAAVYCTAVTTDAIGRRDAAVINRLAREVFREDAATVPLRNSDAFVAPRPGAGKRAGAAAAFDVDYTGFSPEARTAFQYAVDVWSALIESSVPIRIDASWSTLSSGVLGSAGPDVIHSDFGFGEVETWYPSALANALAGEDLSPESVDIVANFNSDFDNWYFGLDGNTPFGQIDFVTVVLHEIGHGLGFFGTMEVDDGSEDAECDGTDGTGCWAFEPYPDIPVIFERFAEDEDGIELIDTDIYPNPSVALGDVLTEGDVYFAGPAAVGAYGARPPLYSPFSWNSGSSFSHLDENTFPSGNSHSLMTPFVAASEAIHDPGSVGCAIFADIGWTTTQDCGVETTPVAPSIPVLLAPQNGATDLPIDVTLSWASSMQADAYSLEIAPTASFVTPVVSVSGIEATSFTPEGLEHDTQYYWHVRATNAQTASAYSTAFRFITAPAPPAAPELIAPEDGVASLPTTVTLAWQAVEDADQYVVEVDTTAEFDDPVHRLTVLGTEVEFSGLENAQTYFWRVRAVNDGESGEWSATRTFTTIVAVPAPPQPVSPEKGATSIGVDVNLVWNTSPRADRYEVVLSADSTFQTIDADSVLADTSYSVASLENKARYFWRVRGVNEAGVGAWSKIFDFRTIVAVPAVPDLLSPEDASENLPTEVTFSWAAAADAAAYELELSTSINFNDPTLSIVDVDSTSVTVGNLDFGTRYFWRVRAINPAGRSVFTTPFSFTTRIAPPADLSSPITPVNGASGLPIDVTLAWIPVDGATTYRIQVAVEPTFSEGLVADSVVSTNSLVVDSLEYETTYFWRVAAVNDGGQGPWSPAFEFATQIAPPSDEPVPGTPADGATDVDRSVVLEWEPVASADRYELFVSLDSSFAETVVVQSDIEATSFTISDLDYETTYFWRVRALNEGGEGPWSAVGRFTTESEPSGVGADADGLPDRFALDQNYPNPFNPSTTFRFALPTAEHVMLEVIDMRGRSMGVIVDRTMPAGRHEVVWEATEMPSGTYVYRLRAGDFVQARTFVLLK